MYANERDVGTAVTQSGLKRDEVFVSEYHFYCPLRRVFNHTLYLASKIYQNLHGTESTLRVVEESLAKLGFGAVSSAFGLIRRLTLNLCKTILISTSCIPRCLGRRSGSRRMLLFCKSVMKGRYGLSASATSQPSLLIDSSSE